MPHHEFAGPWLQFRIPEVGAMAFQLDMESEPGIVLVTFSGQVSVDERVEALREVRPLLEKLRRVLIA